MNARGRAAQKLVLSTPDIPIESTRINHSLRWAKRTVERGRTIEGLDSVCARAEGRCTTPATCIIPSLRTTRFSSGGPLARGLPRACALACVAVVPTFISSLIQRLFQVNAPVPRGT